VRNDLLFILMLFVLFFSFSLRKNVRCGGFQIAPSLFENLCVSVATIAAIAHLFSLSQNPTLADVFFSAGCITVFFCFYAVTLPLDWLGATLICFSVFLNRGPEKSVLLWIFLAATIILSRAAARFVSRHKCLLQFF
jgi:hypothetical protein